MYALIQDGLVWDLFASDPKLPTGVDVRDVSAVPGIARGWLVNTDGTYAVPGLAGPTASQLTDHAERLLAAAVSAGITGDIGPAGAPLVISADTTADGKANVLGLLAAYSNGVKQAGDTTAWYQSSGIVQLTQAQLLLIARAVMAHTDAAYVAWHTAVAGISASPPTVTSYAQVEAAFASLAA